MSDTKASLEFACLEKAGPVTKVGKMLINYIYPLCFSAQDQKSFSARNLLFGQWRRSFSSDQSSQLPILPSVLTTTVSPLDVNKRRLILFLRDEFIIFLVPSTAGLIKSSQFYGTQGGIGEATCKTFSTPFRAQSQLAGFNRSAYLNSRCYLAFGKVKRNSFFYLFARLLTVPMTEYPLLRSSLITCEPIQPVAPVTNTFPLSAFIQQQTIKDMLIKISFFQFLYNVMRIFNHSYNHFYFLSFERDFFNFFYSTFGYGFSFLF